VNIRQQTINLVRTKLGLPKENEEASTKNNFFSNAIIIIDEVDVFFTSDFYANVY